MMTLPIGYKGKDREGLFEGTAERFGFRDWKVNVSVFLV